MSDYSEELKSVREELQRKDKRCRELETEVNILRAAMRRSQILKEEDPQERLHKKSTPPPSLL